MSRALGPGRLPRDVAAEDADGGGFPVLLTADQLCELVPGTTRQYWAECRYRGTGPVFVKLGGRVFYRESDVLAWVNTSLMTRTDRRVSVAGGDLR